MLLSNNKISSLLFSVLRTLAQFIASEDIKRKLYLSRRFQKGSKVRQETIFLHSQARRSSARARTHIQTNARLVSRRENRIYSPSHCLNGRSRRNANFLCHGTIESAYTRGRNNVTSAKRDRKMEYRDVESLSVYAAPRSKFGVSQGRNCRRVRLFVRQRFEEQKREKRDRSKED